jgi:hypothetical protein
VTRKRLAVTSEKILFMILTSILLVSIHCTITLSKSLKIKRVKLATVLFAQ